jgi:heterotetrameric sarcosine oxidase alpha subunit
MTQTQRRPQGGLIDRQRTLHFEFDGRRYQGHEGDTLASALIANGVQVVGRSFKYHRPRGVFATGADEPNALVQLGVGARSEPNVRATQLPLYDGLVARSQNCWPSARHDLGAVMGLLAPFIPAGFYYKTFLWPRSAWHWWEPVVRHAAGLGRAGRSPDPDHYVHTHAHAEVLVVGTGPAGLSAALTAVRAGRRTTVVDDAHQAGGLALDEPAMPDGQPVAPWVEHAVAELKASPLATLLLRTTAYARYDHGQVALLEECGPDAPARQRRWLLHAEQVVLASGAAERSIVFSGNDLPGVMLASAARSYATRYAALPGRRAVVFTNNDSGHDTARDLQAQGIEVLCVVDSRPAGTPVSPHTPHTPHNLPVLQGHAVVRARGPGRVRSCEVRPIDAQGNWTGGAARHYPCDLVLVAGGWNPRVHLSAHLGARPGFDTASAALQPAVSAGLHPAGACAGAMTLAQCVADGERAARDALAVLAGHATAPNTPATAPVDAQAPVLSVQSPGGKAFVDLQCDVTTADVELAYREGFESVEHIKRYTALGMGTDQGKTSGVLGAAYIARTSGASLARTGVTTFRPPYTPVTLGALSGLATGRLAAPVRTTPLHSWHVAAGARFMQAGQWERAQLYPQPGESDQACVDREALAVRTAVGLVDVSTLGKFELEGPDVATLLDRLYVNGWQTLAPGRSRYGVMLRVDGTVLDDGTTSRLSEDRYLLTTTTGNAERIHAQMLFALQVEWPELDVRVTNVTEQWGAFAIAGPRARDLLGRLAPDFAIDNVAFPYLSARQGHVGGVPVRVLRISFSGELGYEVYAPARQLRSLWDQALQQGKALDVCVYGTEAMMTLRIEKGFFVPGFEADGRTTLDDLGMGRMLNTKKACIGQAALDRPAFHSATRPQLVGIVAEDPRQALPRGAVLVSPDHDTTSLGYITSMAYSPELRRWVALALLENGRARHDSVLQARAPIHSENVTVRVVPPVFIDPEGKRTHG